jgi:hypothetical protein
MKILTTILLLLFCETSISAQKVRLVGDYSRYLCLNDSIADAFFETLKRDKVDSIISILYDYDNGRLPNSLHVRIWTHNGKSKLRFIEGCDSIINDTTFVCDLTKLWEYIKTTNFDDVSIPIKSGTGQSHDQFYHITISTPVKSFFVVVSDNQRKATVKNKTPESDTRVFLANKVDALLNEIRAKLYNIE